MQTRKIGSQGFTVSALALGAMGYGKLNDRQDLELDLRVPTAVTSFIPARPKE